MAKNPRQKNVAPSKKHLDRMHREQRLTRLVVIGTIAVVVVVILVVIFGVLYEQMLKYQRSVAVVNGERITAEEFRDYTKYYRFNLIRNAESTLQFASMFGNDPNYLQSISGQLSSIASELEVYRAGQVALDRLIDTRLVIQEAKNRGITVSPEEVEEEMQGVLGYYPDGTPTPTATLPFVATSTLSPAQIGMLQPTATPGPTEVVTATAAPAATESPAPTAEPTLPSTPAATPTPYTLEGYQNAYATLVANYETDMEIGEASLRYVLEAELYRRKLQEQIVQDVVCEEEQVWAQHILVPDAALAAVIQGQLAAGEDWYALAAANSTDTSNKDQGGDLGWFGRGKMVKEFEDVAFALEVGQVSEPVQSQFGTHIIRVLGHENRPLTGAECGQMKNTKFDEWLTQFREGAAVEILDFWQQIVPIKPTVPPEIQQVLQQYGGAPLEFQQQP
jgi:parvulin-like peptidyl-prolyl isomerase